MPKLNNIKPKAFIIAHKPMGQLESSLDSAGLPHPSVVSVGEIGSSADLGWALSTLNSLHWDNSVLVHMVSCLPAG